MFSMQVMIREAVTALGRTVSAGLKDGLPEKPPRKPLVGPAISLKRREPDWSLVPVPAQAPQHQEDGCPACKLHRQVAEGRGLADWLALNAQPDGSLPHPEAGTLPLIKLTLQEAAEQVQTLAASRPDLGDSCRQMQKRLTEAASQVPTDGQAKADDARQLAQQVDALWKETCSLVSAYWQAPAPAAASTNIQKWYQEARRNDWDEETAMRRLQEVLSGDSR